MNSLRPVDSPRPLHGLTSPCELTTPLQGSRQEHLGQPLSSISMPYSQPMRHAGGHCTDSAVVAGSFRGPGGSERSIVIRLSFVLSSLRSFLCLFLCLLVYLLTGFPRSINSRCIRMPGTLQFATLTMTVPYEQCQCLSVGSHAHSCSFSFCTSLRLLSTTRYVHS